MKHLCRNMPFLLPAILSKKTLTVDKKRLFIDKTTLVVKTDRNYNKCEFLCILVNCTRFVWAWRNPAILDSIWNNQIKLKIPTAFLSCQKAFHTQGFHTSLAHFKQGHQYCWYNENFALKIKFSKLEKFIWIVKNI